MRERTADAALLRFPAAAAPPCPTKAAAPPSRVASRSALLAVAEQEGEAKQGKQSRLFPLPSPPRPRPWPLALAALPRPGDTDRPRAAARRPPSPRCRSSPAGGRRCAPVRACACLHPCGRGHRPPSREAEPAARRAGYAPAQPRRSGGQGSFTRGSNTLQFAMATEDDVKQKQIIETRARNISHNVRCTECGSQSIEDSQADVAILLRKLIRDEIRSGKSDKEIYKKLEDEFGETVLYAPKFDLQTAGIWLSPVIVGGIAAGIWAYQKHRQRTNVHIMALNLVRGVPLTPREKETMLDILTPPPPPRRWWWPGK